ncbi:SDR family oxidoreductase [Arthrobacter sp. NPDC056886]|uniref:SDR family oxidoreductase n=1 Tax=Arthrobacter sp. NPDC056886 TaxID=3345960 RepID=UPI003670EFBC
MTRICVAGGTGQVGREVVRRALDAGHSVAVLSRNPPPAGTAANIGDAEYFRADVTTGEGVAAALAGADVVIDCLEGRSGKAPGRHVVHRELRSQQLRLLPVEGRQGTRL